MNVYFVGAGPGDPDLITVRGRRLIEEADIVIYAGSLVSPDQLKWTRDGAEIHDSASMTLEEVTAVYERNRNREGCIVRLHTGDPSVYGAIMEQIDWCREHGIGFEIVPGVSSASAAAAALELEYTLPGVSQTLILSRIAGRTKVPEKESLARLGEIGASLCLFLSVQAIDRVAEELVPHYGRQAPVAVVYRASWPDQRVIRGTLETVVELVKESGIDRQALIIVGRALDSPYERSKLYDAEFSHGYRKSNR